MQSPRSNQDRTEKTRAALIAAARALFVDKGYAETATPEIVAAAGITRGALYHHFRDKRDLFRAVAEEEARAVVVGIEASTPEVEKPLDALLAGSRAYLDAMAAPGRTRLLLIEAPAVLGLAETRALDEAHAARTLREGLAALGVAEEAEALGDLLSAAFDRAALALDAGGDRAAYEAALSLLIRRLVS
ncbi:TetR family transcriptional regulator [Kaistia sp. 32K]|uniref:TetR/AcrR family transcriptional regulator n=1 Tax=Kaistia sp. 32K TaxID=2795690 RepID=UPI001915BA5A|nr:TetR/AcrR family transcriptional regulator [Kaistia sp. 32K]BCP52885.1 TetR family transcriptional regulator [Kaistia sp. 32K]